MEDGPTPREQIGAALIGFGYSPDYANALLDRFAHERSAGAAPIDVKVLATILAGHKLVSADYYCPPLAGDRLMTAAEWAADIAAEYVRLLDAAPR